MISEGSSELKTGVMAAENSLCIKWMNYILKYIQIELF